MNATRKSLTKSLHTVSAVVAVALYMREVKHWSLTEENVRKAVKAALRVLGQGGPWAESDETVQACVRALFKACLK